MMSEKESPSGLPPFWEDTATAGKPINLVSVLTALASRWPFLIAMTFGGALLALALAFLLAPRFTAHATFLPPAPPSGSADNPLSLLIKTPSNAIYTGLLLSDNVLTDVVSHSNLQPAFKAKDLEEARVMLKRKVSVSTETNGFVTLKVTSTDPKQAQEIASSFLWALSRLNNRMAINQAAQQRCVFQTELEREKNDLSAAEVNLKTAQEASGVVLPISQTLAGLSAIDSARAEIRAKQVALASLLQGETEQSPDVVQARSEIAVQEAQLRKLQSDLAATPGSGFSAAQAPSLNLRFLQLEREVKYHQVLFDITAKQFETAHLQESSAAPGVQVVDYPELPLRKSWPSKTLFTAAGAFLGLLAAFCVVFYKNRMRVLREDAERALSLQMLHQAWSSAKLRP